ncbi:hypothetical protein LT493_23385 [Streptomyces tricolor]|nr:hypothetical protein [Streptomyces tricolor]
MASAPREKLVVRDVVKDADGTLHTRYERTYDGLPVLGGDLVVHTPLASRAKGTVSTTYNNSAQDRGVLHHREVPPRRPPRAGAEGREVHGGREARHGQCPQGDLGRRRHAEAGLGDRDRRLPGRRHAQQAARHHRCHHRQGAVPVRGDRDRRRQHPLQRPGVADVDQVGLVVHPDRRRAAATRRTTSTTPPPAPAPCSRRAAHLGRRHQLTATTAAADAAYGAQETWGLLQGHLPGAAASRTTVSPPTPASTTATPTPTPTGTTAASA